MSCDPADELAALKAYILLGRLLQILAGLVEIRQRLYIGFEAAFLFI